ncbi:hypothetical protein EDB81DRAFT_866637 [Dactylonectria macrodidyma]|uniref:DUF6604 domain-containing protein n=1 Tax=Dactylonectria macrodidyma TaxID=307937 RepID=A0A9P9FHK7_9HYPO|nr:hypothetical protein EDB81DRAFT_866637 [Dactylonectria macrodidyma]
MLPGSLSTIYQQYKKDTDSVASWLASTAKASGYPANLLEPVSVTQPKATTGRLKGKARKEAQKQKDADLDAGQTGPRYIIAIKDFVPLAEFVSASTKPVVSVPASFVDTIDRNIYMRSKFGSKMATHGMEQDTESDASHSYFVGVLEKVREVLKPRMPVGTAAIEPFETLNNRFSGLDLFEPSQEFLDAPDVERPNNAQGDNALYEAEPQTSLKDAVIAFVMMLVDINKIRACITQIWIDYKNGSAELASVAVATNTGIDLARNLIDQVLPTFEPHGGAVKMLQRFFLIEAEIKGFSKRDIFGWGINALNEDVYEVANSNYLNAVCVPVYHEGAFGTYDPKSDRASKGGLAKLTEDRVILCDFFSEATLVARFVPEYPVEDEFIRGIREVDKTGKIPFYLVYATQILLDIHHIIRERASDAVETLREHSTVMVDDLRVQIEFHRNLKTPLWSESDDRAVDEFLDEMIWFCQDPVFLLKEEYAKSLGHPIGESERFRILFKSPILCGLSLYHYRAAMHDLGIVVEHAWSCIQEGLLRGCWTEMDMAQKLLGVSNLFIGDRPKNKEAYERRFFLRMGFSASTFAARGGRRQPNHPLDVFSRVKRRSIKGVAPVSRMFMQRYWHGSGQVDLSPECVDQIISLSKLSSKVNEDGTIVITRDEGSSEEKKKRRARPRRLSPADLIFSLNLALGAEVPEFSFPYLVFHRTTLTFLRQTQVACDPALQELYGRDYLSKGEDVPFVAALIFMATSLPRRGACDLLMGIAAEVLNKMIASGEGKDSLDIVRDSLKVEVETEEKVQAETGAAGGEGVEE